MQGDTKPEHGPVSWGLTAIMILVGSAVIVLILFVVLMAALGFIV